MYTPGAWGADESVDSGNIGKIALNLFKEKCVSSTTYIISHLPSSIDYEKKIL
jgi:hypothetical protein